MGRVDKEGVLAASAVDTDDEEGAERLLTDWAREGRAVCCSRAFSSMSFRLRNLGLPPTKVKCILDIDVDLDVGVLLLLLLPLLSFVGFGELPGRNLAVTGLK